MRAGRTLTLAVGLVSAACATSPFDRHFEAGRYVEATESFEGDPELRSDERALYRAGVARAAAPFSVFDPDSARAHFNRLLVLFPETEYRRSAEAYISLLDERDRLSAQIDRLRAEVERLNGQSEVLTAEVESLRVREKNLQGELRTVRGQLESLKEIDLRHSRPQAGDTVPPTRGGS